MNLFELATLLSPVGGAVGGVMAVHRVVPATPGWLCTAILLGVACGIGCYRGLIRLAVGRHDKNVVMPGWQIAAILGITLFAPLIAGTLSYGLLRLCLYVAA